MPIKQGATFRQFVITSLTSGEFQNLINFKVFNRVNIFLITDLSHFDLSIYDVS